MPGLETLALIVSSLGSTVFAANALYIGTYALALGGLAAASALLVQKPEVPKPEDGSYNLKQNVPSLAFVLGWAKKGGDYVFLEEKDGDAYHIIVQAAHRIDEYIQHYLHDEKITLDVDGVITSPEHFDNNIVIKERLGLNAETAYSEVVDAFPTIWSNDHRGDGLASVMMKVIGTSQKSFMERFPNQMPELSSVIAGMRLFDPRTSTTAFSRNLPLMRRWHLASPVGGRMTTADLYSPEWEHAADVADQDVLNRDGETEKRYHGGFWFRANNDPVDVGKIMDQAAELVVYERADGLVGVHAGEYVEPDITLTADDIISFSLDGNTRDTSNVLAARGRYTRLDLDYNQGDAAVYGDPYADDQTERTLTIDNQAIQSHNHVSRLMKIAFTRANAPRLSVVAHYEPAEYVPYRRFVRVNISPKLPNVVVEITESPTVDLRSMTVSFAGIVIPETLYVFDPEEDEGEPGNDIIAVEDGGVPVPENFDVVILRDRASGILIPYGLASWDAMDDKLTVEVSWQPTDVSEPPRSLVSEAGDDSVRTGYLDDGEEFRFRARAWGGGQPSAWTDYVTRVAVADTVEPLSLRSFATADSAPRLGSVRFEIETRNDDHLHSIGIYRVATGASFDPDDETPIKRLNAVNPSSSVFFTDGDDDTVNLVTNSSFSTDTDWTKGAGWTISGGKAQHAFANATAISQPIALVVGTVYRYGVEILDFAGGLVVPRLTGGTNVSGPNATANGIYMGALTAVTGNNALALAANASFVGSADDYYLFEQTADCAPQGVWDYYAVPFNPSGVQGPVIGPRTVRIY